MKSSIKSVLLLLLIFGITSCKDKILGPNSDNLFYPLKVGNVWEYNIVQYDSIGNIEYEGDFQEKVIADTIINGKLLYEIESPWYIEPACCDYHFYYHNSNDGLYFLIYSAVTTIRNNHIYKYPCSEGESFSLNNIHNDSLLVVSTNDTITCEAGIFKCIVYKGIIKDVTTPATPIVGYVYTYISPGTGKIKLETFSINSNQEIIKRISYTLKSYSL